jgi:hypothetical protein
VTAHQRKGTVWFGAGIALMVFVTALGKWSLQPALSEIGIHAYREMYGDRGMLRFLLFAVGFPLGAGMCLIGAMRWSETSCRRTLSFAALAVVAAFTSVLVPVLFGTGASPVYFGTGGVLILALVAAVFWFWGRQRARLPEVLRGAADLQACGYLWFAVAAWNLCGVGSMPSYALDPLKMIRFGSQAFATGQMKVVMLNLVLGWTFSVLGFRRALLAAANAPTVAQAPRRAKPRAAAGSRPRRR